MRTSEPTADAVCRFCERIIPVQMTCSMTIPALTSAAKQVARLHAQKAAQAAGSHPLKFAGESCL